MARITLALPRSALGVLALILGTLLLAQPAHAQLSSHTVVLGKLTGAGAPLHDDNTFPAIAYYGTDLGYTYEHNGSIQFMFGDTWATESGTPIESSTGGTYDDAFGSIDISEAGDPGDFEANGPPAVRLAQHLWSSQAKAFNPGHPMESFKTPIGGFSNGTREYGVFYTSKPLGCLVDNDCDDDVSDLHCDNDLGYFAEPYTNPYGFTGGCFDGTLFCNPSTMSVFGFPVIGSGFCSDDKSSIWGTSPTGRIMATGLRHRIGVRSTFDERNYVNTTDWLTNKFIDLEMTTVQDFREANGAGYMNQNYSVASGSGAYRRVFLWGRPGYYGVHNNGRPSNLYFAYVDMPTGTSIAWQPRYFTGFDSSTGEPTFGDSEYLAKPLDLDAATPGEQPDEPKDVINQMSVAWVEGLHKWVMIYGGGASKLPTAALPECGVVEFFLGADECDDVQVGDGSFWIRTADDPFGPWTAAEHVISGGDPTQPPANQYAPGGVLHHPGCQDTATELCAEHTDAAQLNPDDEYGFFYGANIIESWIDDHPGSVDLYWNASTWDPYGVILMKTTIDK